MTESVHDRYSVIGAMHDSRDNYDDEETYHNNSSRHDRTASSGSSYSGTYGTSFVSDGSEALDNDEFFVDDDSLSLESQPMVVDHLVDSACACLDHPVSIYQRICLGRETSLLRQSKGKPRSTFNHRATVIPASNASLSAANRRNLRLQGGSVYKNAERNEVVSIMEDAKKDEIKIMRIQPKEDFEFKEIDSSERRISNNLKSKIVGQEPVNDNYDKRRISGLSKSKNVGQEPMSDRFEKRRKDAVSEPKNVGQGQANDSLAKRKKSSLSNSKNLGKEPAAVDAKIIVHVDSTDLAAKHDDHPENVREKEVVEKKNEDDETAALVDLDVASMVERAIEKHAKEGEQREIKTQFSNISKERELKLDPPTESSIAETLEGQVAESYPANVSDFKELTSESEEGGLLLQEDASDIGVSPSLPFVDENEITELEMLRGKSVSPSPDREISNLSDGLMAPPDPIEEMPRTFSNENEEKVGDDKSISNSIEIIDVLSMDDQDSWIPVSRNDTEHVTNKSSDDFSRSINNTRAPNSVHTSSMDELWIEEEAKFNKKLRSTGEITLGSKGLTIVQSVDELWNEERKKKQKSSGDIFDDPKAREAFLDRRQGRLRDAVTISRNQLHSIPRHKKILNEQKDNVGREESIESRKRDSLLRSKSLGRSPPSPEIRTDIQQSRSKSRDRSLTSKPIPFQQGVHEPLNISSLSSRMKDLVAIRSIEEGQRMRSTKRAPDMQRANSNQKSNIHAPIDIHSYIGESLSRGPYDELQSRGPHRRASDRRIRSSTRLRSKSRGRDPTGTTDLTSVQDPGNNYRLSDERDDQESPSPSNLIESRPTNDNTILATEKLRKLEKKIERQLRQVKRETKVHDDLDSQTVHSKEIRRIERKLSNKLKTFQSDDPDAQIVSSREIRRLEKQLAQRLSGDSEKRASKLRRIKRRGTSSARALVSSSSKIKDERRLSQVSSTETELDGSPELVTAPSLSSKSPSQKSQDIRPDRAKYESLHGLRSRYVRRGYSRVPETD